MAGKKKINGKGSKSKETKTSKKDSAKTKDKKKKQEDIDSSPTTATEEEITPELSNVKTGSDLFKFPNGDSYLGSFEATIDHTIYRQGYGLYARENNDSYRGYWQKDILNGEAKINYADGSSYNGNVQEFEYNGEGVYKFPNLAEIRCEFVNNIPVTDNDVVLKDPRGHIWLGKAEKIGVRLKPVNHFLLNVEERIEHDRDKFDAKQSETTTEETESVIEDNKIQKNISTGWITKLHANDEDKVTENPSAELEGTSVEEKSEKEINYIMLNSTSKEKIKKSKTSKKE